MHEYKLPTKIKEVKALLAGRFFEKQLTLIAFSSLIFFISRVILGEAKCDRYIKDDSTVVDCSLRGLEINVPQDLDESTQVMNLSGNKLVNINKRSFEKYKKSLVKLDLSNPTAIASSATFDNESFAILHELEYLDISKSCLPDSQFIFPKRIKILKMNHCLTKVSVIDLSEVRDLKELHAADCSLAHFPYFFKYAPLQYLDLRDNPLSDFRIIHIAPFCQVKTLLLKMPGDSGLQHSKSYCDCIELNAFFIKARIETSPLNCYSEVSFDCITSGMNMDAVKLRHECLDRTAPCPLTVLITKWWLFSIVVFVLLLLSLAILSLLFLRIKRKPRGGVDENEYYENEEEEREDPYYPEYGQS